MTAILLKRVRFGSYPPSTEMVTVEVDEQLAPPPQGILSVSTTVSTQPL